MAADSFDGATSASVTPTTQALELRRALVLFPATETAWRVCDSRRAPHTPGYLLGFVELFPDRVELMQVGERFIWTAFADLDEALTHIAETAHATETDRAAGELAWIGRTSDEA